jgi:hypothetical protein
MGNKPEFFDVIIKGNEKGLSMDIDQISWEGKNCVGKLSSFIDSMGTKTNVDKKPEYYQQQPVQVNQRR